MFIYGRRVLTDYPIEEVTVLVAMEDGHFQLFTVDSYWPCGEVV